MTTSTAKEILIKELNDLGVTHTQSGVDIRTLDFEQLNEEFVHACYRKIDTDNQENAWF